METQGIDKWNLHKIKDFGIISTGTTPSTKNEKYYGGSFKLVSPADLTGSKYITTAHKFLSEDGLKFARKVSKNAVLVACIGNIGKIGITTDDVTAFNQQINAISCNPDFSADFVYYLLKYHKPLLESKSAKVTLPILNKNNFENIELYTPGISEQKSIAYILSLIQDAIQNQEALIASLKKLKASMMHHLFTHGTKGEKTKMTEIGEVPESWSVSPLSEIIASLEAGVSVNSQDRPALDGEKGILKTSCVTLGIFDPSQNKVVIEKDLARTATPLKSDVVIISRMNTPELVGACAYVQTGNESLFLPDRLWQVSLTDQEMYSMKWLSYQLQFMWKNGKFAEISSGTSASMKNITKSKLLSLKIGTPDISEQNTIAAALSAIDEKIEGAQEKTSKYQSLFRTLLHELMSGERRVIT